MSLDLSDLSDWEDSELLETLNEITHGLSDNQLMWIERYSAALEEHGELSERQREVAEKILKEWNDEHG